MYRQSINNIKVAIIPLDGTIFDLNRYRYNYYHHLCDHKHIALNKDEFYNHLSNMYDMYNGLPLSGKVDTGPLNSKIEREMCQYLKHKGLNAKDGFFELLEYLHQKNIQIAVISTHRTKDAVQYLQMAHIYNKVHFIIGSDTSSMPLPSTQMLTTVTDYFHIEANEALVISSFMSLNYAASEAHMNIIYCEDLVEAGSREKATSYKVVHNLFDVLNSLLFDRYEEAEMYSPLLGMNPQMNKEELDATKDKLEERYQNDSQILNVIDQTYAYHISQLNEQTIKDGSVFIQKTPAKKSFHFSDEESQEEPILQKQPVNQEEPKNQVPLSSRPSLNTKDDDELTSLLKQINQKEATIDPAIKMIGDYQENEDIVKVSHEETYLQEDTDTEEPLLLSFIVNLLYIIAISFLILFIGLIIYVAFIQQFIDKEGIFGIIAQIFDIYDSLIVGVISGILNGIHTVVSFVPSYHQYETSNIFFSVIGVKFFNIFIFHTVLIGLSKIIILIIKRRYQNEVATE